MLLRRLPRRLRRDDHGQDLIEYAVIAAFICLVAVVGATTLGNTISAIYHSTTHSVEHGATFTTNGSASTSGGDCRKDAKDAEAGTSTPANTSSTSSTSSSTCK